MIMMTKKLSSSTIVAKDTILRAVIRLIRALWDMILLVEITTTIITRE